MTIRNRPCVGHARARRVLRLWKLEPQNLVNELRLALRVRYFPSGASRWNRIKHRAFCHITQNWGGRALVSRQAVVNLFGQTTPARGLRIQAKLDTGKHQSGIKVTDDQFVTAALEPEAFYGEGNYTIQVKGADRSIHVIIANCLPMNLIAFSLAEMTRTAPWRR